MDWFLYDRDLFHERDKTLVFVHVVCIVNKNPFNSAKVRTAANMCKGYIFWYVLCVLGNFVRVSFLIKLQA